MAKELITVVTSFFNGSEMVRAFREEVELALSSTTDCFEIIMVDDGSSDTTWSNILEETKSNHWIRGIRLSRNYGQQVAMSAGIQYASGDYVVLLDCDLQNPTNRIADLLDIAKTEERDVVYATSIERDGLLNRWTSRFFWFVMTKILNVDIVPNQLMMRVLSRKAVDHYKSYPERTRTVAGVVRDIGLSDAKLEVENRSRKQGKSGYNLFSRLSIMIDMIISLTVQPLNYLMYFGSAVFLVSLILMFYFLINYVIYDVPLGYTSTILSVFLFGSLNTVLLGFIGRYLAIIYTEVKGRPLFITSQTANFPVSK